MRRALAVLLLVAACGGSPGATDAGPSAGPSAATDTVSTDALAVLRAGAAKTTAESSRITTSVVTKTGGQEVTFTLNGAFDPKAETGLLKVLFDIAGKQTVVEERIVDGTLYLQVPGQGGWYAIKAADVAGTSLAQSADPTSTLGYLAGVSDDVAVVGSSTVRGEQTTHYRGTIDAAKALAALPAGLRKTAEQSLGGTTAFPFDAYVDGDGRVRQLVQTIHLEIGGQSADTVTTTELYDFGTEVVVQAPPAAEVKDGTPLLKSFGG